MVTSTLSSWAPLPNHHGHLYPFIMGNSTQGFLLTDSQFIIRTGMFTSCASCYGSVITFTFSTGFSTSFTL